MTKLENADSSASIAGRATLSAITLREGADQFMKAYAGRDPYIAQRLAYWVDAVGERPLAALTFEDCEQALDALIKRGATRRTHTGHLVALGRPLTQATINRYILALMSFWKGAAKLGLVSRSLPCPAKGMLEREGDGRTRFLSAEEFTRLRHWAAKARWNRLEALIVLAVSTALRAGSLRGLRWKDVNLGEGTITVARTKNGSGMVCVLVPAAIELLAKIPGPRDPQHYVFRGKHPDRPHNFRKAFEQARRNAGLADGEVCFHSLRHTAASWAAQAGHSPLEIAALTGHKSLVSLRRYTHLNLTSLRRMSAGVFGAL
jgi:integrase